VTIIEVSKPVNATMSEEDIDAITTQVVQSFGVEEDDVIVEVVYTTTGQMNVTFQDSVNEDALAEALENELVALLDLHEGDIDVHIDFENGTISYTIASSSVEDATEVFALLSLVNTTAQIEELLETTFPAISVESVEVSEAMVDITVTVDTSDASESLIEAEVDVEAYFVNQGYSADIERIFFLNDFVFLCEICL